MTVKSLSAFKQTLTFKLETERQFAAKVTALCTDGRQTMRIKERVMKSIRIIWADPEEVGPVVMAELDTMETFRDTILRIAEHPESFGRLRLNGFLIKDESCARNTAREPYNMLLESYTAMGKALWDSGLLQDVNSQVALTAQLNEQFPPDEGRWMSDLLREAALPQKMSIGDEGSGALLPGFESVTKL